MKKKNWITIITIFAVIIFAIILMNLSSAHVSKETAECIGENSILYVQLGCHTCEIQEDMFGKNYQYLKVIDCWIEENKYKCGGITHTPTWIIDGEKYVNVQSIEKLKELTGCE